MGGFLFSDCARPARLNDIVGQIPKTMFGWGLQRWPDHAKRVVARLASEIDEAGAQSKFIAIDVRNEFLRLQRYRYHRCLYFPFFGDGAQFR